ncbi:hypothetical protein LIA77_06154 [Sarocladium implicatum]|nr:hypothetical protein LIA77_06154 [Sarocladium implicatum]
MSLNDRVKDALQGSDSDVRPPGSFPTDDMSPEDKNTISNTHQRNKLHKANDPRGRGHGHSDSGVGIMDSSNEPAATKEPVEEAYAPAEGYEERREHAKRSNVAEFDDVKADKHDTTEYDVDPNDLGTTAATATGANVVDNTARTKTEDDNVPHNVVRTGKQGSTLDHADPYWGNLPQGQGTYNTVAGHGSSSDEARRHHSGDDTSGQRTFPLVTDRTRQHHQDPAERRFEDQQETQHKESQKDSHWKEGTAGAAGAGAAGTAAYLATRDHDERTKNEPEETAEEKEKKKSGGLFGIFHRDHKGDKHKEDKHKEDTKLTKEDKKHTREEKAAPIAAAGFASRDDKHHDEQTYKQLEGDNHRSAKDPAVAAAATAYATHAHDGNTSSQREDPIARGNDDSYNRLADGTPSGVRTGGPEPAITREPVTSAATDDHKDSNRNAAVYGTAGTAAALGAGGYAAHELRKDRDEKRDEPLSRDTTTTTTTRDEAPRSGGWFTSPVTNTSQTTDPVQSQRDTFTQEDSSRRANPAVAAAPVVAASSLSRDPAADTYPSAATTTTTANTSTSASQPAMREPSTEIPRTTATANEGKYNTLSSGTPSGINVGGTDKPATTSAATTLPTVQDEKSNRGAMATAGIAATAAGAGGAYYATRDDEQKKPEEEKPLQKETKTTTSSVLPGSVGGQEKVTHKCVKCGEENDVTHLIKEKARGH